MTSSVYRDDFKPTTLSSDMSSSSAKVIPIDFIDFVHTLSSARVNSINMNKGQVN